MTARMNPLAKAQKALEPMLALEAYFKTCSLEPSLMHLVKIRASQINGCAYCLHMHTLEARKDGEGEARIYLLDAWRESGLYTPRERAALTWTETLTEVSTTHAPDADYEAAVAQFGEQEMIDLTLVITNINAWNRICVGFRAHHPNDVMRKAA
ncbi:carboxymuconolactone decarboxylase family protein [Phenylobacterium sp.]|uniref:carboxymuconolactone decarboxylase family protein n=1 Tax=Phenylobacterium sp. TaxID=1871053 RepID=UPI003569A2B9